MLTIKSASEEILCAVIARNEVRKNSQAPLLANAGEFQDIFTKFLFIKQGLKGKEAKKAEKERVQKIKDYLEANPDLTLM